MSKSNIVQLHSDSTHHMEVDEHGPDRKTKCFPFTRASFHVPLSEA